MCCLIARIGCCAVRGTSGDIAGVVACDETLLPAATHCCGSNSAMLSTLQLLRAAPASEDPCAGVLLQGGGVAAVLTRGADWLKTDDGRDLFIDFGEVGNMQGSGLLMGCSTQQTSVRGSVRMPA